MAVLSVFAGYDTSLLKDKRLFPQAAFLPGKKQPKYVFVHCLTMLKITYFHCWQLKRARWLRPRQKWPLFFSVVSSAFKFTWVTLDGTVHSSNTWLQSKAQCYFLICIIAGLLTILLKLLKSQSSLFDFLPLFSWVVYSYRFKALELTSSCV